ncbi:MAG: hypothetical protein LC660_14135, partial [Desulfobacteraceae bacterium]|nr:hypothetical protein [Desulfobacteraceae bacterium]
SVSSQLSGLIHRKSEGNPLYIEELIRVLISHDLLEKNPVTGGCADCGGGKTYSLIDHGKEYSREFEHGNDNAGNGQGQAE